MLSERQTPTWAALCGRAQLAAQSLGYPALRCEAGRSACGASQRHEQSLRREAGLAFSLWVLNVLILLNAKRHVFRAVYMAKSTLEVKCHFNRANPIGKCSVLSSMLKRCSECFIHWSMQQCSMLAQRIKRRVSYGVLSLLCTAGSLTGTSVYICIS